MNNITILLTTCLLTISQYGCSEDQHTTEEDKKAATITTDEVIGTDDLYQTVSSRDNLTIEEKELAIDDHLPKRVIDIYNRGLVAFNNDNKLEYLSSMQTAAKEGHIGATFELGKVAINEEEAIRLFTIAARKGHIRSAFNLGTIYENTRDYTKSISWYETASRSGSIRAKTNLGYIHAVIYRNPKEAARWYTQAAEENDIDAMMGAASAHYELNDISTAKYWANMAAQNGHPNASVFLEQLN